MYQQPEKLLSSNMFDILAEIVMRETLDFKVDYKLEGE